MPIRNVERSILFTSESQFEQVNLFYRIELNLNRCCPSNFLQQAVPQSGHSTLTIK